MSYNVSEVSEEDLKKILASWDNEDFFDIQSKKYLEKEREEIQRGWSEVFAEEYNKEIDMESAKLDHINPKHYKNVAAGKITKISMVCKNGLN